MSQSRLVSVGSQTWAYLSCRSGLQPSEINATIEKAFGQLTEAIARGAIRTNGAPRAHYHYRDDKQISFDLGFPIREEDVAAAARAGLSTGQTLAGEALMRIHEGPYAALSSTYKQLEQDLTTEGLSGRGDTWEVYLNDPDDTPPSKLQTQIYWPINERSSLE